MHEQVVAARGMAAPMRDKREGEAELDTSRNEDAAERPGVNHTRARSMPIATTDGVAGWRITTTLGLVLGLAVRDRGLGGNIMVGLEALGHGGALDEYRKALVAAREEALARMAALAMGRGANAVVGVRFDASAAGHEMSEIVAYGTAVILEQVP